MQSERKSETFILDYKMFFTFFNFYNLNNVHAEYLPFLYSLFFSSYLLLVLRQVLNKRPMGLDTHLKLVLLHVQNTFLLHFAVEVNLMPSCMIFYTCMVFYLQSECIYLAQIISYMNSKVQFELDFQGKVSLIFMCDS